MQILDQQGEEGLNGFRNRARRVSQELQLEAAFARLDKMIGTLLHTRQAKLRTAIGQARAARPPYDLECLARIRNLIHVAENLSPPVIADPTLSQAEAPTNFIESYFSNYIEGTEFPVEEAQQIVRTGTLPKARPADGHDILSYYREILSLPKVSIGNVLPEQVIDRIRSHHREMQGARPENRPGLFKTETNVAGATTFVAPNLVEGTLLAGLRIAQAASAGFVRAVALHFLLTDVHPFDDGNGRIARLMLTSELRSAGLSRIVVPNVYRAEYLSALRALTRHGDPAPLVRAVMRLQAITAAATADSFAKIVDLWASANAFMDPADARLVDVDESAEIEWRDAVPGRKDTWARLDTARLATDYGGPDVDFH